MVAYCSDRGILPTPEVRCTPSKVEVGLPYKVRLMDHFAGQALSSILSGGAFPDTPQQVAAWAYIMAEAMMEERKIRFGN